MRTSHRSLVLLATLACAGAAATPAGAADSRLLGLPLPALPLPGLPALPALPATNTPLDGITGTVTDAVGTVIGTVTGDGTQVTDPTGNVIGILDPVTGIVTGAGGQVIGSASGTGSTPSTSGTSKPGTTGATGTAGSPGGPQKPADTRPPGLRLNALSKLTYAQARTQGMRVTVTCDELCSSVVYLTTGSGSTAKLLGAGVASGLPSGYAGTFRVKLFPKAFKNLSKRRNTVLNVVAAATDAAGNSGAPLTIRSLVTVPVKKARKA